VAGAASYTVKVYASNGSTLLQTIASAVSPLTVSSLTASTGYKVSILAVADGTHTSSAESAQSSVTTANRIQLIAQVPAATTITASSVTVTVPTVSGATGYSLQILNAGNNAVVQSSSSFVSGTTLTGLTASTNYVISVLALGDGITYSDSVAATATFSTSAWPQLAAPALAVSSSQPTSASVSWSAVAGAASYTVKVYASNGSTLLQTIASAVSPLTVSGLTASTGYKVSILAVADGTHTSSAESAQSSVTTASATTAPIVPPVTVPTTPSVDPAPAPAINTSVSLATADVTVVGQQAKVSLSAYINGASTPKATLISGDNVVQGLTLVDGNLVLTLAPKFSGKATVVVLADTPSQKVTVNIPVLVAPVPASKLEAAQSGSGIPTFNWLPSLNAQLYILAAGEVTLCKTEATACALKAPLANGTKLTLTALGADQTTSEPVELSYQGPAKLAAGTVSLGAPSKRLLSGEKTLLASAISSATQLKYGKVIVTAPAAVAGQALLKVRAVKAFLRQASAKSAVPVLVRFVSGQKDVSVLLAN
jgi:predicted peroxiredoxin